MSRRQTLGALSPAQLNTRPSLAGKSGKQQDAKQGVKQATGRPSIAPRLSERPSNIGIDRRSSAYGKNSGVKQDPRPLNDKNFFNSCMRTVITYLSSNGYPYAISPKLLASPTGKDFAQIVQFLFQKFDPNLKAFGKVEDEVPLFFKRMNYPFQISKSALFAVGSPHSWPSVLAALTWLVELLNYEEKAEGASYQCFDDQQRAERQFYQYVATSYRYFLAGEDHKCQAADDEMLGQFKEREASIVATLTKLKQANEQLAADAQALQSAPSPLLLAQQHKTECLADKAKFEAAIENCQATKASLARRISERSADVASKKAALAQVLADNTELQARIAAQALSKADVNRMVAERQTQKSILEGVSNQREELDKRAYQQDMEVEGALKALEEAVRQYNLAAHSLALIPVSAKRADGAEYEINLDRNAAAPTALVNIDLKGSVKPGLMRLRERYRARARDLCEDALQLAEALDAAREAISEKGEDLAAAQQQAARLEERYRGMKEEVDAELRSTSDAAECLKGEVAALRNSMASRLVAAEEALKQAQAGLEALQRSCCEEVHQYNSKLMAAVTLMLQHASDMKKAVRDTQAGVNQAAAEIAAAQLPLPSL